MSYIHKDIHTCVHTFIHKYTMIHKYCTKLHSFTLLACSTLCPRMHFRYEYKTGILSRLVNLGRACRERVRERESNIAGDVPSNIWSKGSQMDRRFLCQGLLHFGTNSASIKSGYITKLPSLKAYHQETVLSSTL